MDGPTTPDVDGLHLLERLPQDRTAGRGELWRARRRGGLGGDDGHPLPAELPGAGECVVRLLRLPVDPVFRARAMVLARDLTAVDDAHLVRVLEVRAAFEGLALVLDPPPAPVIGLDGIGRRRMLQAGELVTVGVAVSWALDVVHRLGLAHGDLQDADIVVPAGGRPMLGGVGIPGVCGAPGDPRDDVRSLARVLASLLDHDSPGATEVLSALEPARGEADDTAAAFAVRLAAATPPLPVAVAPDAEPDPDEYEDDPAPGAQERPLDTGRPAPPRGTGAVAAAGRPDRGLGLSACPPPEGSWDGCPTPGRNHRGDRRGGRPVARRLRRCEVGRGRRRCEDRRARGAAGRVRTGCPEPGRSHRAASRKHPRSVVACRADEAHGRPVRSLRRPHES